MLQQFTRSSNKSVRRCGRETEISRANAHRIIKTAKWKYYVPRLLHATVEDDPDRRAEFCGWFAQFMDTTVWSDEATFKLNCTDNRY
jgi:hypothetical protein